MADEGSLLSVKVLKQGSSALTVTINITVVELTASSSDFEILTNSITFERVLVQSPASISILQSRVKGKY